MERQKILKDIYSFIFILVIYMVGVIGHSTAKMLPLMIRLTPLTLLLSGTLILYSLLWNANLRLIIWCLGIFTITLILEIAGVSSGMIFGSYHYGDSLGYKLLEVPLIIGFNWTLVLLGSIKIAGHLTSRLIPKALISSLLVIGFDIIMEPVAIKLSYWDWYGNSIPVQNYTVWGVLGFSSSILFDRLKLNADHTVLPERYFIIQCLFFLILNCISL